MNPYKKRIQSATKTIGDDKRNTLQVPVNPVPRALSSWLRNKMADALGECALISSNINQCIAIKISCTVRLQG